MSETNNTLNLFSDPFRSELEEIVERAIKKVLNGNGHQHGKSMEPATPYLTIKETAKLSRLGASTIRLYIRKRELKAHQVGSRVIIKRTELERFLEAHPIEVAPD